MSRFVTTLAKKKNEGGQTANHCTFTEEAKRSTKTKQNKTIKVLGKILKMAARFKGKHRCGGGGEGGGA